MKAICVTPSRGLDVRDIPTPAAAAPGHVLVDMDASAINHGDKTFLKYPTAAGTAFSLGDHPVWGASGAGRVVAVGDGVPRRYLGRQVAIYRSLERSPQSVGLWCERAHVPWTAALILPEHVQARDYCGSLVNVMTAHAFLEEVTAAGHNGVVVTAGNSATGHALAALARRRRLPAVFLVRSDAARDALRGSGVEHVIVTRDGFADELRTLSADLDATAVFDGVGGALLAQVAPQLPMNATFYVYGVLGAATPITIAAVLVMARNLTIRRFSNFESATVKNRDNLMRALLALEAVIDDPLFTTRLGEVFGLDDIDRAMAWQSRDGAKAVLAA